MRCRIREGIENFHRPHLNISVNECAETDVIMSGIAISKYMEKEKDKIKEQHLAMFPIRSLCVLFIIFFLSSLRYVNKKYNALQLFGL